MALPKLVTVFENIISNKSSKIFFNQISFCRMVFYFTCQSRPDLAQKYIIYMGRDKFENEALIHNGWPEDLWFHVDGQFYKKIRISAHSNKHQLAQNHLIKLS